MPVHVGLYPNLDNLVYNQYRKYDKAGYPALRKEFTHFYFLPLFLASMLKVAWGTARRRSAGISLPVSRQMPYVLFSMRTKAACNPWMNFNWRWARRVVSSLDKVLAPSSSTLYVGDVSSVSLPSAPLRLPFYEVQFCTIFYVVCQRQ